MTNDHDATPKRPTLAGDWTDDDASYTDDIIVSVSDAPAETSVPREVYKAPNAVAVVPDRAIGTTLTLETNWSPVQALPRDEHRAKLLIDVYTLNAEDRIRMASHGPDTLSVTSSASLGAGSYDLGSYTGAVFLSAEGLTGRAVVSVLAITR